MKKFNPDKLKFLIEAKGYKRPTDKELASILGVKINSIARWKKTGHRLFDDIHKTKIPFETLIKQDNKSICEMLKYTKNAHTNWEVSRPNVLISLQKTLRKFNIKFENIYD